MSTLGCSKRKLPRSGLENNIPGQDLSAEIFWNESLLSSSIDSTLSSVTEMGEKNPRLAPELRRGSLSLFTIAFSTLSLSAVIPSVTGKSDAMTKPATHSLTMGLKSRFGLSVPRSLA